MAEALRTPDVLWTDESGKAVETLVADARGDLSPAEMVEQKLFQLLWGNAAFEPTEDVPYRRPLHR